MKIGDIVRLKSGGPDMTVCGYDHLKKLVSTDWFTAGARELGRFHEDELVKVKS
jgi:uncharacterized protein YodC (DUF2158 family)